MRLKKAVRDRQIVAILRAKEVQFVCRLHECKQQLYMCVDTVAIRHDTVENQQCCT